MAEFHDWDKLLYGIGRGECILFLGPDLPRVSPEGDRRAPAQDLADRLSAKLRVGPAPGEARNLPYVAQRFLAQEDEVGLELELTRWHQELRDQPSTLHDDLAVLPFRWIVTSGHDPLMETALARAGRPPAVARYHYRGTNPELLPDPSADSPVLFHLYGRVEEPPSVVLTETQLLDFLAKLIARDPPLPNDLNAVLANGRLFLFLGFGLHQWYLRILLHVLKVLRHGNRSFALETTEVAAEPGADDAVLFYQENYKVEVRHTDVVAFAAELRRRYTPAETPDVGAGAAPPVAGPPSPSAGASVFICHANEDAAKAREVHDALSRAGLRPWLDKRSLRGGDRWDELIESTIKGVDYFVVLNSRALAAKSREASYVNKEIKLALRAEDLRLIGRFIVPASIDDTPLLEPLARFHSVDLTAPEGLRDLVRAIKRQQAGAA